MVCTVAVLATSQSTKLGQQGRQMVELEWSQATASPEPLQTANLGRLQTLRGAEFCVP